MENERITPSSSKTSPKTSPPSHSPPPHQKPADTRTLGARYRRGGALGESASTDPLFGCGCRRAVVADAALVVLPGAFFSLVVIVIVVMVVMDQPVHEAAGKVLGFAADEPALFVVVLVV